MSQSLANRVHEGADIIDSRDVIARIEELEGEREALLEGEEFEDQEELDNLLRLAEDGEGTSGWTHGEALIADQYFEDYARQLAEDIGAIKGDEGWPLSFIDWTAAAEALQQDYFSVEYGSTTYWIRA